MTNLSIINLLKSISFLSMILIFRKCKLEYNKIGTIESKYPNSFTLNNGNILIIAQNGVYLFTKNDEQINTILSFTNDQEMISTIKNSTKTTFLQLSNEEGGYVFCLIKDILYIFSNEMVLLHNFNLTKEINGEFYFLDLIKENNNFFDYIISFVDINSKALKIVYYQMDIETEKNTMINNTEVTYIASNGDKNSLFSNAVSCEIMKHSRIGQIYICFHENRVYNEIGATLFKPDSELNLISILPSIFFPVTNYIVYIKTVVLEDKSTVFICYEDNDQEVYCFFYNININEYTKYVKYNDECRPCYNCMGANYFSEIKQLLFYCSDSYSAQYQFTLIGENDDIIQTGKTSISDCYGYNTLSVLFLSSISKYIIILDCPNIVNLYSIDHIPKNISINDNYIYKNLFNTSIPSYQTYLPQTNSLLSSNSLSSSSFLNTFYTSYPNLSKTTLISNTIFNSEIKSSSLKKLPSSILTSSFHSLPYSSSSQKMNSQIDDSSSNIISTLSKTSFIEKTSYPNNKCDTYIFYETNECSNNIPSGYYLFDQNNKIIKKCHDSCKQCITGPNENSHNCQECINVNHFLENGNCVEQCSNNYISNNEKICLPKSESFICPENRPYFDEENMECVITCDIQEILDKKCEFSKVTDQTLKIFSNKVNDIIINNMTNSETNILIEGNDLLFHISTTDNIKKIQNKDISTIDFGECETKIKAKHNIDYIIIKKIDVNINEKTIVLYELYNPKTKVKIDLSLCYNDKIEIYTPINDLEEETINNYYELIKEGYNIFDPNDDFYNDICTQYTSQSDTDILLTDRKNAYFHENLTYCQSGCTYKNIIVETNQVQCECSVVEEPNYEISNVTFDKIDLVESFFEIEEFSNYKIIICYNLVFSIKGQTYNFGSYILIILIIVFVIVQIKFVLNQKQLVGNLIKTLLKSLKIEIKHIYGFPLGMKNTPPKKTSNRNSVSFNIIKKKSINNLSSSQMDLYGKINSIKSTNRLSIVKKKDIKKKSSSKSIIYSGRRKSSLVKNIKLKNNMRYSIKSDNRKSNKKNNLKNDLKNNLKNNTKYKKNNNKKKQDINDDEELNILTYEEALIYDKREFREYYCSLLMKKDLIFFSFLSKNNYNLKVIKIGLFVFSISVYITVNSFFFRDSNIHQIYNDNGIYDIIFQLPPIIYSSILLIVFNIIIQFFAISEKDIIRIKSNKERNNIILDQSIRLFKCLRLKFNLFFIIGFVFLCLFWYFVSAFCAVYRNTQKTYFKNCLLSFSLSMLYRFIENIIPALLRVKSLKMKNGKCVFLLSKLFALL